MTKEDFKARVSMAYEGREQWEAFLNRVWSIHTSELPHWISVEDELPPRFKLNPNVSVNVLTYGLHTMVNWYDYEWDEWAIDREITHWMPLPQAPVLSNSENTGKDEKGGEQ